MANPSPTRSLSPGASSHALHGLSLPVATLQALQRRGIYCTSGVTVEHQHLAKRYVLRGVESGGAWQTWDAPALTCRRMVCLFRGCNPSTRLQSMEGTRLFWRKAWFGSRCYAWSALVNYPYPCMRCLCSPGEHVRRSHRNCCFAGVTASCPWNCGEKGTGVCVDNLRPSSTRVPEK